MGSGEASSPPGGSAPVGSTSVKVTHLSPTVTKEKLLLHFRRAGEISGDPAIHITETSVYAHVNYYDPLSAQNALTLNGSHIDGTKITVKLAKQQQQKQQQQQQQGKAPSSKNSGIDCDNYEEELKLEPKQWNTLMMVKEGSSTTLFQEIMSPYKTNPNVMATPDYGQMFVKFKGKLEAVEDARKFLKKHLKQELFLDR